MTEHSIRLISTKATCAKLDKGRTWLWEQVKKGAFPKPISVGSRAKSFVEREVDQWIEEQIQASRKVIPP